MLQHFIKGTAILDRMIPGIRRDIVRDTLSPDYGGVCLPEKGFAEPGQGPYIGLFISAYYNQRSAYYHDDELLADALLIQQFMLRKQHEDGTIDLRETNFHCAPTVGFSVQILGYAYRLIQRDSQKSPLEAETEEAILTFIRRGAEGMKHGGFHTPNHRWVITSALSLCYNILGDEECRKTLNLYLNEGIDCDKNGEYTERSAGIYNVVNNRSLMIVAEELGKPELLEHVRRNLRMVPCYFDPDGTVFTLNSTRQDNYKKVYPIVYYENYMIMACRDHSGEFAGLADWLFDRIERMAASVAADYDLYTAVDLPTWLLRMQLDQSLIDTEIAGQPLTDRYHRFFEESGVVRGRAGDTTYTILANSPAFFFLQRGNNKMSVRFGTCYYAKGQMQSQQILPIENGYRLQYACSWGFKRPFPNGSDTPDWRKMDHSLREKVLYKTLTMTVDITKDAEGLVLTFSSDGMDELPAKMEFTFEAGGYFATEDVSMQAHPGDALILKKGDASYCYEGETITLSGGQMEHAYTTNMRGTTVNDPQRFTVYVTAMGQFTKTVRVL